MRTQALEALALANEARLRMAKEKRALHSLPQADGCRRLAVMLEARDPWIQPAKLRQLLMALRFVGEDTTRCLLMGADVFSGDRRVRELSDRQLDLLVDLLRRRADR